MTSPTEPTEKTKFSMEVTYSYKHDKETEEQISWFYHWVETDTLKRAITATKKYFTEMLTSTGWTSKVKIISIEEMRNDKSKPETQVVSPTDLPAARTKSTGTARKSQTSTTKKTTTPRKPRAPRTTKPKPTPPLPL